MSMSSYVIGIVPADENYQKMLHVYDACVSAGIPLPDEVDDFFDGELPPNRDGMEVEIDTIKDPNPRDMQDALVVDLDTIPAHVRKLKFINSY